MSQKKSQSDKPRARRIRITEEMLNEVSGGQFDPRIEVLQPTLHDDLFTKVNGIDIGLGHSA